MNTNDPELLKQKKSLENPDFAKHANAALASKEEMDKWGNVELFFIIFLVLSIPIAWAFSSWIIAIAGIIICSGMYFYASAEKNRAKQDTMDHLNRANGMSESLVQATRGRREAENDLTSAISQLNSASGKLRGATTSAERNAAEAEVVSAQAAIESAKLRLQQATSRENSEIQNSKQQTQSVVAKTNNPSDAVSDTGFIGEKSLTNDGYKIYLVKKYKIEKNDALGKMICGDRLFESIDEALTFAHSLEAPKIEETEILEVPVIPELINGINELRNNTIGAKVAVDSKVIVQPSQMPPEAKKLEEPGRTERESNVPKKRTIFLILASLGVLFVSWFFYQDNRNDHDKLQGISKNGIDGWGYAQEVNFETGKAILLLNSNNKNSFRKISYFVCPFDKGYQKAYNLVEKCSGKTEHYTKITQDTVIPRVDAYKDLSTYEEKSPYSKGTNNADRVGLKTKGWNFFRSYYGNKICVSSESQILTPIIDDYYPLKSDDKIMRITYCGNKQQKQMIDGYTAEIRYVESGMNHGD